MATSQRSPLYNNGDGMTTYLQQLLSASQNRDAAIERIASSVHNLATDFNRKLDEAERDTRKQFETFGTSIATQFQNVTSKFEAALATRDAKLESVSAEFLKSRQAPWTQLMALGMLMLAFGGSIGWLAYNPINDRTDKVEDAIERITQTQAQMREFITESFVSHKHLDGLAVRGQEDRMRTNRQIETIQENVFPKAVHEQRWARFDSDIASTNLRIDTLVQNLQREIDVIQKSLGDTYTTRDALFENKARIGELEKLIRDVISNRARTWEPPRQP